MGTKRANVDGSDENNISGFLNMLVAARDEKVKRFVYAASSSTYGDHPDLPKVEGRIGRPLSPYAVTKYVNELYADVFARTYDFRTIGLRYFNIFGPRQDPNGSYAAVIPLWFAGLIKGAYRAIEIADICRLDIDKIWRSRLFVSSEPIYSPSQLSEEIS